MKLIVGLGNIGDKYIGTRHNIGFEVIDNVVKKMGLNFKKDRFFYFANYKNALFIKPTTFMNLSGIAVKRALEKYSIEEILVVVDDIYLNIGQIRIREKGGDGGHNGIKSIIEEIETNKFIRVRVGIGNNRDNDLSDYVLSKFSIKEEEILKETYEFLNVLLLEYISSDYQELLNNFSKMNNSYSKKISELLESLDQRRMINE